MQRPPPHVVAASKVFVRPSALCRALLAYHPQPHVEPCSWVLLCQGGHDAVPHRGRGCLPGAWSPLSLMQSPALLVQAASSRGAPLVSCPPSRNPLGPVVCACQGGQAA